MNLAPCAYLKGFSAHGFFLRETAMWGLFSALTATRGFAVGSRWATRYQGGEYGLRQRARAFGAIAACWLCCAVTVMLTS